MTEQEQVQVSQADRDAAAALFLNDTRSKRIALAGGLDSRPLVQAFARHRHTATAEALEAAAQVAYLTCAKTRHFTLGNKIVAAILAIAKIDGEQP
jgi:hypothetical protein